jgi:hypothetical protein
MPSTLVALSPNSGAGDILINTLISSGNANSRGFRAGAAGELILLANSGDLFHQVLSNYYLIQTAGGNTFDINLKKKKKYQPDLKSTR